MPRKSRFGANASDGLITQIPKRRAELKHEPRGAVTSAVTGELPAFTPGATEAQRAGQVIVGRLPPPAIIESHIQTASNSMPALTLIGEVIAGNAWRAWRKALASSV